MWISGVNIECARAALLKINYPRLVASGIPSLDPTDNVPYFALYAALAYCSPESLVGYENYHKDKVAITSLSPGVPVSSTVDYPGDVDEFTIAVEEERVYRVFVDAGTLQSPLAGRYDRPFRFTDTYYFEEGIDRRWPVTCPSDPKSQEFPMEWTAKRSGETLVIVRGGSCDDLGSYTIRLTLSDN